MALEWAEFAYHYVNEILHVVTKLKEQKKETKTPEEQTDRQTMRRVGRGKGGVGGEVRCFGPDGTAVGLAPLSLPVTSQRFPLQRNDRVTTKFFCQCHAVLNVIQTIHLPLVFDT